MGCSRTRTGVGAVRVLARAKVWRPRISAMCTVAPRAPPTRHATPRPCCAQLTRTVPAAGVRAVLAGVVAGGPSATGTVARGAVRMLSASGTTPKVCDQYTGPPSAAAAPTPVARNSGASMFARCSGEPSQPSTTACAVA